MSTSETPTREATGQEQRTCPRCAEDIDALARACPWCGTRFLVTSTGYCPSCHEMSTADTAGACSGCGTPLVDLRVESDAVAEPAAVAAPVLAAPVAPPPAPRTESAAPARQVVGRLRAVISPSLFQRGLGVGHGLAAAGILLLFFFQFGNHRLAFATRGTDFFEQVVYIGFAAPIMAFVCASLVPSSPLGPKGSRFRRFTGDPRYDRFKQECKRFDVKQLLRAWRYNTRVAAAALLWVAGIGLTLSRLSTLENATLQAGAYLAVGLMVAGLLSAAGLLVTKKRTLWMDDDGCLFTVDVNAPSKPAALTPSRAVVG